jgi:hypothetical protein
MSNAPLTLKLLLRWSAAAVVLVLATPALAEDPAGCFPACRSGYTCHDEKCVSLCNPGCEAGEVCSSAGTCEQRVSTPPPVASTSDPSPAAPAVTSPTAPAKGVSTAAQRGAGPAPGSFVFGAQIGAQLIGRGNSVVCATVSSESCTDEDDGDYTDASRIRLAASGSYQLNNRLRLGLGYALIPYSGVVYDADDTKTWHIGNEQALRALIEALVPVGSQTSLSIGAYVGPHLLIVGGDQSDAADSFIATCEENDDHCEAEQGPFFGYSYGTTLGIVVGRALRWRIDLDVERYSFQTAGYRITDNGTRASVDETLHGTRLWLVGGIEL